MYEKHFNKYEENICCHFLNVFFLIYIKQQEKFYQLVKITLYYYFQTKFSLT